MNLYVIAAIHKSRGKLYDVASFKTRAEAHERASEYSSRVDKNIYYEVRPSDKPVRFGYTGMTVEVLCSTL